MSCTETTVLLFRSGICNLRRSTRSPRLDTRRASTGDLLIPGLTLEDFLMFLPLPTRARFADAGWIEGLLTVHGVGKWNLEPILLGNLGNPFVLRGTGFDQAISVF